MITRKYKKIILDSLKKFPAVSLVGPRQCGKTTIAKDLGGVYFDLEKTSDQVKLEANWEEIENSKTLIVLDEAQVYPEIFNKLRPSIDENRKKNGRFLILGSISPTLMTQVSESLAGRNKVIEMSPLLFNELKNVKSELLWKCGGFPDGGVLKKNQYPDWQESYLELLSQRDLPNWGLKASPKMTFRLFKMLAVLNSQILNLSELGASLGITYKTVDKYLSFLEGAFLIRKLEPYHTNLKKRLIKSPKIYWRDSGLAHYLLGYNKLTDDIFSYPWVGSSWEAWVIEQIISSLKLKGNKFTPYFFRTSDGFEIDLLLDYGEKRIAIEIKLTSSPTVSQIEKLKKSAELVNAQSLILITRQKELIKNDNLIIGPLNKVISFLK